MAKPKAPTPRGFTLQEEKALRFESVTMWLVLLVAVIAAAISFQALTDAGQNMNLRWAAPMLPVAIDGFAVACSIGIIRSQSSGEAGRKRLSEWLGLSYALGVSILGNVYHVLGNGYPDWLKIVLAASIPFIVAYGIHVFGRAMSTGISAYVMADDPTKIHFDITHLGDDQEDERAPRAQRRAQSPAPARAATPAPTRTTTAARSDQPRAQVPPAGTDATDGQARAQVNDADRETLFLEYRDRRAQGDRMQGGEIADRLGLHPGRARSLRAEWDKRIDAVQHAADPDPVDPIVAQAQADETRTGPRAASPAA